MKDNEKKKERLHPSICEKCCWGRDEGGTLFCPFIEGTCLRKTLRALYLRRNEEEEEE